MLSKAKDIAEALVGALSTRAALMGSLLKTCAPQLARLSTHALDTHTILQAVVGSQEEPNAASLALGLTLVSWVGWTFY
jgi:hypothetical protein